MKIVEPKVYLLAETRIYPGGSIPNYKDWLNELGGSEVLDNMSGSDAEQLIELAARRCYKSFKPGLNPNVKKVRTDSAEYHENILKSAHGSVLEHSSATFAFEFVSRVFTHELVRHRQGVAYSQESLRYVRLTDLGFRMPKSIADEPAARALFEKTVAQLEKAQEQLAEIFKIDETAGFEAKKILTSAFRRIAPIGLATGIVATFNFRALRWVIEHRTTVHAEEEIREAVGMVAEIAAAKWPWVFGDFKKDEQGQWVPRYRKV